MQINEIADDQTRQSIELDDLYDGWLMAARATHKGRLRWKHRSGHDYLCLMPRGSDTGRSLGPRSPETEHLYEAGRAYEAQEDETWKRLLVKGRMFKAARMPIIPEFAAKVLRELDARELLGEHIRVIGSMALPAYELEAGVRLPSQLLATEDFDLSWIANATPQDPPQSLSAALKAVDGTWTVLPDRGFQLRNKGGYLIDVVIAPELMAGYPSREPVRALPTPGQEWLLGGTPVAHVVVDTLGKPARIVAPDPRLFALHKLFLAGNPARGRKQEKDRNQALMLLETIQSHMPHYPLDAQFEAGLGEEMRKRLVKWREEQSVATPVIRPGMAR